MAHGLPWKEPDAPYLLGILYEDNDVIEYCTNYAHPVPVHRLGRGRSGVLLCAKTKLAKCCLAAFFADGTSRNGDPQQKTSITKLYRALANGLINEDEVVIDHPIGLVKYPGVAQGLYVASPSVMKQKIYLSRKPALSKVTVLERNKQSNSTLIQVEIKSGRPLQIRIYLSFTGHPLIGDPLYGTGGQPRYTDQQIVDESFAQDGGYERPGKHVPGDQWRIQTKIFEEHHYTIIKIAAPLPSILQMLAESKAEEGM